MMFAHDHIIFAYEHLPEDERLAVSDVQRCLKRMRSLAEEAASALNLYRILRQRQRELAAALDKRDPAQRQAFHQQLGWPAIAARDMAMMVYHFVKTRGVLAEKMQRSPTLVALYDRELFRGAGRDIKKSLPAWEDLRDAIAHQGEFYASISSLSRHYDRNAIGLYVNGIEGDELVFTAKGKELRLDISDITIGELVKCLEETENSFRNAADRMRADWLAWWENAIRDQSGNPGASPTI